MDKKDLRVVVTAKGTYIRKEDVVDLIREFGATEETDVRNRANELADNLSKLNQG